MTCFQSLLYFISLSLLNNRCDCRSVLQPLQDFNVKFLPHRSQSIHIYSLKTEYVWHQNNQNITDVWRPKRTVNPSLQSIPQEHALYPAAVNFQQYKAKLRKPRSLLPKRAAYFGLTAAKFKDGYLLYNQYISANDLDERVRNGREIIKQRLHPWPARDEKVVVPYFFSEDTSDKVSQHEKSFIMQAMEDVSKRTCVSFEMPNDAPVGGKCDSGKIPSAQYSVCIQRGDGCYTTLGASGNPQLLVLNETCLSAAMALRLVTLTVGLGYHQSSSNYMLADKGARGAHAYCHTDRENVSLTFDIRSAATVGFTINFGSSSYEAVHVTPNPEEQAMLHRRGENYFGLRNIDIAAINAFNQCDKYSKCGDQMTAKCKKYARTAKYPNVIGINKKTCKCLCVDGWKGTECDKRYEDEIPAKAYGCHKHVMLGLEDRDGTGGIFRLKDIHMDTTEKRPLICTVSIRSKFRDLGYYCPGYAPTIKVDARALYKVMKGFEPFSFQAACERFRMYYQSGRHKYRRRVLCLDHVFETGGRFDLRPAGPNTTLFFVMDPENNTVIDAMKQIQIVIHNRVNVLCDMILYYRNPASVQIHRGEFIFRTRYLIQALIGIVVFLIFTYILYDYWSTKRRLQALKRRKEANAAREAGASASGSSKSHTSSRSSLSAKSIKMVVSLFKGKEKKNNEKKKSKQKKEDSDSSDSLELVNPFQPSKSVTSVTSAISTKSKDEEKAEPEKTKTEEEPEKSEPEVKKEKPKKAKKKKADSMLPPIGSSGGTVKTVSDLDDDIASVTGAVEEPTPFSLDLGDSPPLTPSPKSKFKPRPKVTRKGAKGRPVQKKRRVKSSSSSSSGETLKQAVTKYISGLMTSTTTTEGSSSDSEDMESEPV